MWWEAYKLSNPTVNWTTFAQDIEFKFGSDDYRTALAELIELKQTGSVDDYTITFQALQYKITMHSAKHDELYFAMQYVAGLRDDIKAIVEPQVPLTVDRAALIAKIQQKVLDRSKHKFQRQIQANRPQQQRQEGKQTTPYGSLWRDRQL